MSQRHSNDDEFLGRLAEEFLQRYRSGQAPSIHEYATAHSVYYEDISNLLSALVAMEKAALEGGESQRNLAGGDTAGGKPLGDFLLRREIGRGGMGVVYEAEQLSLGRTVALKVLPLAAMMDQRRLERFQNEAQAAARLHHSNIVPVHAVGSEGGIHYYAMQYIEGSTLEKVIHDLGRLEQETFSSAVGSGSHRFPRSTRRASVAATWSSVLRPRCGLETPTENPSTFSASSTNPASQGTISIERSRSDAGFFRRIAELAIELAEALDYAHEQGVIHRDIKPSNLILDEQGRIWIADFGLARIEASAALTGTGDLIGTLRYMSPEQSLGKRQLVDHRTDIYSLGATLYELLTLAPAFAGENRQEVLRQIEAKEPKPLRRIRAAVPVELETIVLKAMAKEPRDRYETAQDLAADLHRFLEGRPLAARRSSVAQRFSKLVSRHRTVASLLVAFLCVSLAMLGVGTFQIARQRNRAEQAMVEAHAAQRNAETAAARLQMERGVRRLEQRDSLGLLDLAQAALTARDIPALREPLSALWSVWIQPYEGRLLHLVGHDASVHDVAFSPDGRFLVTASADGTARLWDATTGQPFSPPMKHPAEVWRVAFSPDGALLATGAADGAARLWNTETFELQGAPLRHPKGVIRRIEFSPDGRLLATGVVRGEEARVWNVQTGRLQCPAIRKHSHRYDLDFSPSGDVLAAASHGDETQLWDIATGKPQSTFFHPNSVQRIRFSPDGKTIATAAYDRCVRWWDVASGEQAGPSISTGLPQDIAFSPDGRLLAAATAEGSARIWKVRTDTPVTPPLVHTARIETICFSPDSRLLATTSHDQTARLWNAETGEPIGPPLRHADLVWAVAFSPDGSRVATASRDGGARIWSTTAAGRPTVVAQPDLVRAVEFDPQGNFLAVASGSDLRLCDPLTVMPRRVLKHPSPVFSVAVHPRGAAVATGTDDGAVCVWDASTGKRLFDPIGHQARIADLAFSPDGEVLAVGVDATDANVFLYDALTGQRRRGPPDELDALLVSLAFDPTGKQLAIGTARPPLRVWDLQRNRWVPCSISKVGRVNGLAFNPVNSRLAVGCADGETTLHDPQTGDQRGVSLWHNDRVFDLAFSPQEALLATASRDGTVRLWSTEEESLHYGAPLRHDRKVADLAFHPDGRWIATGCEDDCVRLWEIPELPASDREIELATQSSLGLRYDGKQELQTLSWREWQKNLQDRRQQDRSERSN